MSKNTNKEGVVDAKNAVATVQSGAVSAQVAVQGVQLKFPFIRVGQQMSTWRCDGNRPNLGAFYIGKDKANNTFLADCGADKGFRAILLDVVGGYMEDKPFTGAANPPRRFMGPDALAQAEKAGLSLTPVPTGEVWPDTQRPKMRATLSKFCYLQLLVPVTEDFPVDYQMFPIGDRMYTPARIEFSKGAFKELDAVIGNIERVEKFHHRKDPDYRFSWSGRICRIYTTEVESKQSKGTMYPFLRFTIAYDNGKAVEFTEDEKKDFTMFLSSVTSTTADIGEATESEFE